MTDRELLQHEFIDTTAKWGRDFVEVLNPLKENEILRVYYEPPQKTEPVIYARKGRRLIKND